MITLKSVGLVLIPIMFVSTPIKTADAVTVPIPLSPRETVTELVQKYSTEYKVSGAQMMATLQCEDTTFDFTKQSDLTYKEGNRWGKPAGSREQSYGVAQIHLPDHKDITYEQATDPDFAVKYMAEQFSLGKQKSWSCYHT